MKATLILRALVAMVVFASCSALAQIVYTNQSVVTVRAVDPYASEPHPITPAFDAGRFEVFRSGPTNIDLLVYYTVAGTATPGVDYDALSNSVVIPKGSRTAPVVVMPRPDWIAEGVETVVLRLTPIACIAIYPPPPECYLVGQPREAVVYIRDSESANQAPKIQITKPAEGDVFPAGASVDIEARAIDPDGYVSHMEFFADGRKIGEQVICFLIAPPNGTPIDFSMTWVSPPVGRHVLTAKGYDSQGLPGISPPVTIVVGTDMPPTNRPPVVSIVAADPVAIEGTNCWGWPSRTNCSGDGTFVISSSSESGPVWWYTNCGPKSATFVVRRAGDTNAALDVLCHISGTASNGVDYAPLSSQIHFAAGQRAVRLLVVPLDDDIPEPIETVIVRLRPVMSTIPPVPYFVGYPDRAGAVIVDRGRPRPILAALQDRSFLIGVPAMDGSWHRIECSTDLSTWTAICTNQAIQGAVHFMDPEGQTSPARFYRAALVSEPPDE